MRIEELILDGKSAKLLVVVIGRLTTCRLQVVSRPNNHIW